jgi:5-methyltetrahydrofolate--homocysteine methyltransferase
MIGGPGSLALFMGTQGRPAPDTLWYKPCIEELDGHPPLELDVENAWWTRHVELFQRPFAG